MDIPTAPAVPDDDFQSIVTVDDLSQASDITDEEMPELTAG